MSPGQIAALVAAGAFVLLVLLLAIPLVKLGRTLDEAALAIRKAHEGSGPLLDGAATALTQVSTELERVDDIMTSARALTGNVSALSSVFTATLGGPLVKAAAFSFGLRRAVKARKAKKEAKKKPGAGRRGPRSRR